MASKYNNSRITVDGIRFQSKHEALYYELLKRMKANGLIMNYELQPQYILQPARNAIAESMIEE